MGALAAVRSCEDHYAVARRELESIISFLKSGEAREMSVSELEVSIRDRSWEMLRELLQAHIEARGPGEAAGPVVDAEGVERTPAPRQHERTLTSVCGDVWVERLGDGKEGQESLHPLDADLNLPAEQYSFGLRRLAAVEAAKGSFEEAVASVQVQTATHVGKRQLEELVQRSAQDFDSFYAQREPPAGSGGEVLVISADGKGVPMRRSDLRAATRKAAESRQPRFSHRLTKGEKRHLKRMATVAAVYTIAPRVREPTDILGPLAPRHESSTPERPKPESKRVWASLKKTSEDVIIAAFIEARRRDPLHERRWVALVDGSEQQLRALRNAARRLEAEITIVLDFIHVSEYVWKASMAFFTEKEAGREDWVEERLLRILRGESSQVAAGMRRSATLRKVPRKRRNAVDACAKYLLGHTRYLRYDRYLEQGLPIATGVIE